jgi:serine phosphatase RsbU (regulator of sigma subunit)
VLLVEDDEGDALLVREWLSDLVEPPEITWVSTLAEAQPLVATFDCVLLDLGLPDTVGLEGVSRLRSAARRVAVVVLTGYDDELQGIAAVAAGAQDYLVKGAVTGALLARTIRYAVQRRRFEDIESALLEERLHARENARLERSLLPRPLVRDPGLLVTSRYRSGGRRMLLGGDFYDAVEDPDGALHVIIGDVAGHGPDQAALGVGLRIAWRTLVLAGRPDAEILPVLGQVLANERTDDAIFATVCSLTAAPDRRTATMYLAGHPAPLLRTAGRCASLPQVGGPALGLTRTPAWPAVPLRLPERWEILLYTDGIVEGRTNEAGERLGSAGLVALVDRYSAGDGDLVADHGGLLDTLITAVTELNAGPLTDDLALLLIAYSPPLPSAAPLSTRKSRQ